MRILTTGFENDGTDNLKPAPPGAIPPGRKAEAEAAIPADYIDAMSLVGPEGFVRDCLEAFKASGVTSLQVAFHGANTAERVKHCEALKNLLVRHGI